MLLILSPADPDRVAPLAERLRVEGPEAVSIAERAEAAHESLEGPTENVLLGTPPPTPPPKAKRSESRVRRTIQRAEWSPKTEKTPTRRAVMSRYVQ